MTVETWLLMAWAITFVAGGIAFAGWLSAKAERDAWKDIADMWHEQWGKSGGVK